MPTVKVRDINMYYEIHGEGQPLMMMMGLGSDLTMWMFQIPEFSKKYQVIVLDNRGVGRTDAPDKPYSIKMMADDTVGLMDALRIDRAHILGISMGGYIAQEIAIRYPRRTRSLIMATTTAAPSTCPLLVHITTTWVAAKKEGVSPETYIRLVLPYLFTAKFFETPELVKTAVDTWKSNVCPQPAYAFARQETACNEHDARARLNRITMPTLVLVGKEDILIPVKLCEELAATIPKAKFVVLEGGGHGFNIEIRDKFNQAVMEFLGEIA